MIITKQNMIIYVDVDETICHYDMANREGATNYRQAKPYFERISKINKLYEFIISDVKI